MDHEKKSFHQFSWLWKWVINNQMVSILLILLLFLTNIALFTKVAYLFRPVLSFLGIIGFPVIFAAVLFYLMKPILDFLLKRGIPKWIAIWLVLVGFFLLIWGIILRLIPLIQEQLVELINQFPYYYNSISETINQWLQSETLSQMQLQLDEFNTSLFQTLMSRLNGLVNVTVNGLGNFVGVVGEFVIGILTMPIILFYLLKDGDRILPAISRFFPTRSREKVSAMLGEMNMQISQYIRGQITVAIAVGIMFAIGYQIIGLEYGITIAVLAGIMNVIPYVGSFIGMVPAIIVGFVHSPIMLIKVLIVFMIEQTIEGRIISPLILGNSLKMHPVTILFILLAAGKIFGVMGLLLGIPGYAVLKVIASHAFDWYKQRSGLYEEEKETSSPELIE